MRYIQKVKTPHFFIVDTHNLTIWSDYYANKKRVLKEHILKEEQNYLCIYCESKISSHKNSSHLEHIQPKAQDKYPELTFKYSNLAVSCNGTCNNEVNDNAHHNCGHIKKNMYNEEKFLNPIEVDNIRAYFIYDFDEYAIESSPKDDVKSEYMINTLNLNDNGLKLARKKALNNFIKKMKTFTDITLRKEKIKAKLNQENIEQISFLRYKYQKLL